MSERAIKVENLSKRYRLGESGGLIGRLRGALGALRGQRAKQTGGKWGGQMGGGDFWALRDVSFEVGKGEVLGVIGRNGAGKSTLLKLLARITRPTEGRFELAGRVGSLLEVGTGFHPELTGRENIYLNGAILGLRRRQIDGRFDEIVDFSGVEAFLDTPVKRYSSGMRLRLAFAVAAHLEPEILIIDEVLAVGDAAFQSRCLGKMRQVATSEGRTVLFVSHHLATVGALCDRCILLEGGRITHQGDPTEVVGAYLHRHEGQAGEAGEVELGAGTQRIGDGRARIRRARLLDGRGERIGGIAMGEALCVELEFELLGGRVLQWPSFGVAIRSSTGQPLFRLTTRETVGAIPPVTRSGRVRLHIDRVDLLPGNYLMTLAMVDASQPVDQIEDAMQVRVAPKAVYPTGKFPPPDGGFVMFAPCSWELDYQPQPRAMRLERSEADAQDVLLKA